VQQRDKAPPQVYIEKTQPRNAAGKVAKPVLRERLQGAEADT